MVEASANELSEDVMVGAIEFAQREMQGVLDLIEQMKADVGEEKLEFEPASELSQDDIDTMTQEARDAGLKDVLLTQGKKERGAKTKELRNSLIEKHVPDPEAEGAARAHRRT